MVVAKGLVDLCGEGGFTLAKFASNLFSKIDSFNSRRPTRRGLQRSRWEIATHFGPWYLRDFNDPETDFFARQDSREKTRTEVLSAVMGIFDPIGFVGDGDSD